MSWYHTMDPESINTGIIVCSFRTVAVALNYKLNTTINSAVDDEK